MGTVASVVIAVLNALVAIPSIVGSVESVVAAVTLWFIQRQTNETLASIADATAQAAHAQSDEERFAAAKALQDALSQSRVTPN